MTSRVSSGCSAGRNSSATPSSSKIDSKADCAHRHLPVREEIVGVAVLLDAHHLAAEEAVLLDEQGVDAPLLKQRRAGTSAGSAADHDDVVRLLRHDTRPPLGVRQAAAPRHRSSRWCFSLSMTSAISSRCRAGIACRRKAVALVLPACFDRFEFVLFEVSASGGAARRDWHPAEPQLLCPWRRSRIHFGQGARRRWCISSSVRMWLTRMPAELFPSFSDEHSVLRQDLAFLVRVALELCGERCPARYLRFPPVVLLRIHHSRYVFDVLLHLGCRLPPFLHAHVLGHFVGGEVAPARRARSPRDRSTRRRCRGPESASSCSSIPGWDGSSRAASASSRRA